MDSNKRFCWDVRPAAAAENQVRGQNYRFTVLTDRLIRLEYAPHGRFEDRATQTVFYRDFPRCDYTLKRGDGELVLETAALILRYREEAPFAPDTLRLKLKAEPGSEWGFGEPFEDLGGTARTLDTVNGRIPVGRGVCSRWGFSVLDDSDSLALDDSGWVAVRAEGNRDSYFFGYGYDYRGAVRDFYRLTGAPSMLPAYALGNWWSRYHAYTQEEYLSLIQRFADEDIPFSVGVVDMDWHITEIPPEQQDPNRPSGWTGYTWNRELFPDYRAFLKELHEKNLKTALNLHPADGVRRHEEMYPEMAKACGVDPETGESIWFDILSPEYMGNYFDILHHPYEEAGVDFWWMDWQQGTDYSWIHEANKPGQYADPRERLDPLWMLNHLHILDISRSGKRPMFFSRFSGPGSHRYPVGFSGDTVITWDSLKFQPEFTAMASNVGYCWWSHDIGGHMMGVKDDQMVVRWIQLGVFSPINRLHSSNSPWLNKEPWSYGPEKGSIMKDWLRLRHRMFPYLYTMNRRTHAALEPLVQPMYYSHPKCAAAYEVPDQFWFGSELIVVPVTQPNDPVTGLGETEGWIPDGCWFDLFTGLRYASRGGRKMRLYRPLERIPVLAKSGAIVPLAQYEAHDNRLTNSDHMEVLVFPGESNTFTLYEDGGDGSEYRQGAFAETEMNLKWDSEAEFTIRPASGDLSLIPESRKWSIRLRGFHRDAAVSVKIDGRTVEANVTLDPQTNTVTVTVSAPVTSEITLRVTGDTLIHDNADVPERCKEIIRVAQIPYGIKDRIWESITDPAKNAHRKLTAAGAWVPDQSVLLGALRELLTLTEDEYLGSQI